MDMNTEGVKKYDDYKGNQPPEPGRYHVAVASVDDSFDKHDALIVTFQVVAGDKADQKGRQLREMFFLDKETGGATDAIKRLAMVLGLIGPGERKAVDWQGAVGRSLVIGVATRKGKDRDGNEREYTGIPDWGLATWPIGDPDVEDVPIDKDFISRSAGSQPTTDTAPFSGNGQQSTGDGEWGDF